MEVTREVTGIDNKREEVVVGTEDMSCGDEGMLCA